VVTIGTPTASAPDGSQATAKPQFQWSPVTGADGYLLTLVDTTANTTVLDAVPVPGQGTTSYTPSAPLVNLDTYRWTVAAYEDSIANGKPYPSPASRPLSFTLAMPVAPVPIAPANDAVVTTTTPTFQWSPVLGAVSYTVTIEPIEVFGTTLPPPVTASVTGTSYAPTTGLTFGSYEWSVQAFSMVGGVPTPGPSSVLSHVAVSEIAQPTLISPQAGATLTTATPTFQWSQVGGDHAYFLSVFDVDAGSPVLSSLLVGDTSPNVISYTMTVPLTNGHTYEWSVSARAASSASSISARFTVALPGGGS
jgi:hypothetical protein